ncbi:MAG: Fur family transcriptional regulator [Clostridia bacterium]
MQDKNATEQILVSWPSSMKKTKARIAVLTLLQNSDEPQSALEIYDHLIKLDEKVNQSTVYRILETFVENAMIKKIHYSDESIAYYERIDEDNSDLDTSVCLSCKKRSFLKPSVINQVDLQQQTSGFTVKSHRMEIYGYCKECTDKKD